MEKDAYADDPMRRALLQRGAIAVWRRMLLTHADLVENIESALRAEHDLSAVEFDVLINIPPHGSIRHRELVREIVLSRSGLSRLMRRMEARGLIVQTPDPEDQRGVCASLTDAGREVRDASAQTNGKVVLAAFAGLSDDDLDTLLGLITRISPTPQEKEENDLTLALG